MFLALSGSRRSELGGLRWSEVDFTRKAIDIQIGRAPAGGKAVEDDPQTEASVRTLPMDDEMVEVLRKAWRRQAADRLRLGEAYRDGDYVACNENGAPYHPDTLTHRWAKVVKKAGVRPIRLHDARHIGGTTMHLRKVPMAVIAAWLGHADASVTARIYTHSQDEALRAAAKTLGEVVSSRVRGRLSQKTKKAPTRNLLVGAFSMRALGRNRTCGLLLRRQTLYPLSYEGGIDLGRTPGGAADRAGQAYRIGSRPPKSAPGRAVSRVRTRRGRGSGHR